MEIVWDKRILRRALLCLAAGLGAGFVNGLAGTGAGVVFLLFWGLSGGITKEVFSLSMACVVPLSLLSLLTYAPPEGEVLSFVPLLVLSAGIGGLCGGWVQKKVRLPLLKWTFALLVIWGGVRMFLR